MTHTRKERALLAIITKQNNELFELRRYLEELASEEGDTVDRLLYRLRQERLARGKKAAKKQKKFI